MHVHLRRALAATLLTAGAALWGAVVAPPDEQADATIARVATSNPIRLFTIPDSFLRFPHPPNDHGHRRVPSLEFATLASSYKQIPDCFAPMGAGLPAKR